MSVVSRQIASWLIIIDGSCLCEPNIYIHKNCVNFLALCLHAFSYVTIFEVFYKSYWPYLTSRTTIAKVVRCQLHISCDILTLISRFKHCSKSLTWPLENHICSLLVLNHMTRWPKVQQVGVSYGVFSNIAQNHYSRLQEVIPDHYWPQLVWKDGQHWN